VDDDAASWLRLLRTPGVGPARYQAVLERFDHPRRLFEASRALQREALPDDVIDAIPAPSDDGIVADCQWLADPDHHLVHWHHPSYPDSLRGLSHPPPLLFVHGDPTLLDTVQLGVVGSRKATHDGNRNAFEFARYLAAMGVTITSGLALGIDGAAHEGALDTDGRTVAVVATGPDRVYPAAHRDLACRVAESGAVVTEFPTGTGVRREYFPRRNRLISGLSLGVLVVEAGLRSGSLVTARHALEQGREVFAIPGSIHNPVARGCHQLIRQGAKLVESARDIIDELPPLPVPSTRGPDTMSRDAVVETLDDPPDQDYQRILDALGQDPQPLDTLLQRTGLTPDTLSSMLLILELKGHVSVHPGGRYARVR